MCPGETARNVGGGSVGPPRPKEAGAACGHLGLYFLVFPAAVVKDVGGPPALYVCACVCSAVELWAAGSGVLRPS